MKAFRLRGAPGADSPEVARLFERGSLGTAEQAGPDGPELVAYFDREVELGLEGRWEDVADVDYLAAYRSGLRPVREGSLVVAPSHRRPSLAVGQQVVWIDPGSAFGTGHHATTRLALRALCEIDLVGARVLDVGSGSGILAIAADKLGAALALGVDIDAHAVEVARRNAALNRSRARFLGGSVDDPRVPDGVDVIVANIYAEVHVALMPAYLQRLVPGGVLLLTGILKRLESAVAGAAPSGASVQARRRGDWSLLRIGMGP